MYRKLSMRGLVQDSNEMKYYLRKLETGGSISVKNFVVYVKKPRKKEIKRTKINEFKKWS